MKTTEHHNPRPQPNPRKFRKERLLVARFWAILAIFSWVGLALGCEVSLVLYNIYMFSDPTEFGKSHTPYWLIDWFNSRLVGWLIAWLSEWVVDDWCPTISLPTSAKRFRVNQQTLVQALALWSARHRLPTRMQNNPPALHLHGPGRSPAVITELGDASSHRKVWRLGGTEKHKNSLPLD